MKHNLNVTILLVCLFLAAQFIGLAIVGYYLENPLPFGKNRLRLIRKPLTGLYL